MKFAVVAAVQAELGALSGTALGVGPVRAAAAAARLLAAVAPDAVLLVGSAGSYPAGPAVGSVVASRRLGWADGATVQDQAYIPLAPRPLEGDARLRAQASLPEADVLTVPAITTDPGLAVALSRHGGERWTVEHLEAMAVAMACAQAGVPFLALLGIANRVGPSAHEEWKANRRAAEAGACAAAQRIVTALRSN